MEPCRALAVLAGCLGLVFILVAVSTDVWVVATGPGFSGHSGLWPRNHEDPVKGYIHVTRTFAILSALLGLVSVGFLVLSCIPSFSAPGRGLLVSCITGFAAALCATVGHGGLHQRAGWPGPLAAGPVLLLLVLLPGLDVGCLPGHYRGLEPGRPLQEPLACLREDVSKGIAHSWEQPQEESRASWW